MLASYDRVVRVMLNRVVENGRGGYARHGIAPFLLHNTPQTPGTMTPALAGNRTGGRSGRPNVSLP